jgi:hypothetical protein
MKPWSAKTGHRTARGGGDSQPHGGQELGLEGMANSDEPLINAVITNKPKRLKGLDQKVGGQVGMLLTHSSQTPHHRLLQQPPLVAAALHSGAYLLAQSGGIA